MLTRGRAFIVIAALSACGRRTFVGAPPREQTSDARPPLSDWESAREGARAVLESHCGECHDPGSGHALPGALRVFDLGAADWSARMSGAQLRDAYGRLGEPIVPTQGDAEAVPMSVSATERETFLRFVELAEQRSRP